MSRMERAHAWVLRHLPAPLSYMPTEAFFAYLIAGSGLPIIILGPGDPTSPAMAALLPPGVYRGWGVCLALGAVALAVGIASIRRRDETFVITRLNEFRLGMRLLGLGGGVYALVLFLSAGLSSLAALAFIVPFVGMCMIHLVLVWQPKDRR